MTLESLLIQTYPHGRFEIVVVDGHSTDRTREIAEEILRCGDVTYRIVDERTYESTMGGPNYGHCFARNLVGRLSNPDAKYIASIDADCRADAGWLAALYETIRDTPEDVAAVG